MPNKKRQQTTKPTNEALSVDKAKRAYHLPPSVLTHLPWVEFDDSTDTVLLQDTTVGAAFDISLVASEAKPERFLMQLRDGLQGIFQDTFPQYRDEESPWILQFYVQDENSMAYLYQSITDYIKPTAQDSPFKETYLGIMKDYCEWLSRAGGVFYDDKVTDSDFQGGQRKVRVVFYRQYDKKMTLRRGRAALQDLNFVATSFMSKLKGVGIEAKRLNGRAFRDWLIRWFNPNPSITKGNVDRLLELIPYPEKPEEQPFGYDFAEQLFYSVPESNEEDGVWYFDELPHRYIGIQHLSKVPDVGHLTRDRAFGNFRYGLFDNFPEGATFVLTVVIQSQEIVKNHLERIEEGARKSNSTAATITFEDCQLAKTAIEKSNFLFPAVMGVYLRGNDLEDLAEKETDLESLLINNGFHVLKGDHDLVPIHSYLSNMPFCYNYQFDKKNLYRSGYVFGKQLANLLPLYGRERGTNHPLLQFLNRGGESFCTDVFNPDDKDQNSHLLLLGSTGSGKSATSTDLLIKTMGTYRPYLVMVDAGNSFHLLKDFFAEEGLSVHHVAVTLDNPPILNPFVDSEKMLAQIDAMNGSLSKQALEQLESRLAEDFEEADHRQAQKKAAQDNDEDAVQTRDYMGEMALAAQLMITGGEKKEQEAMTRQDRMLILDALVRAARYAKAEGYDQMLPEDVVKALRNMAVELEKAQQEPEKQTKLRLMADSMAFFTKDTIANLVFNQRGKAWPNADVTLFEQGLFKDEGYEAHNALAFMGLMSRTMAKAEERQFEERFTLFFGDEIHTITKNLLTVVYLTKCAKMSRKFGLWLWLATQNVADFPKEARKILSMMETWICLGMSEAEMKSVEEFRKLSEEERELFRSVRKASRKYVEGVLLSNRVKALFRNVPPRLSLALAMTEKHEKAERRQLMEQHNISELEAAKLVAKSME
ncbi:MAG: conjugative transfer ATPase [Gammaproteobacteria bacterium CG11_big_fil_rev_8_21_14_0_20_46_22]|nr:MAG: conjugative transfer ATPase [Gammaproteobacteria bacterium CG12_big_fil_rev_8_21_14_0_65_46_12]PIR11872.1 MAG: conjugative transfer ATPase [Gammaproteobacteria bacterium CG11_big_fil_rev_8_21_14_0_20_46_22]